MNEPEQPADIYYTAAKAIITNEEGSVLVLKQSDQTITGGNLYHPPGGIIEEGENPETALAREIEEELGVTASVGDCIAKETWRAERDGQTMHFTGLFYLCSVDSYDFVFEADEVSEAAWVTLDNIDDVAVMEPSLSIIRRHLTETAAVHG